MSPLQVHQTISKALAEFPDLVNTPLFDFATARENTANDQAWIRLQIRHRPRLDRADEFGSLDAWQSIEVRVEAFSRRDNPERAYVLAEAARAALVVLQDDLEMNLGRFEEVEPPNDQWQGLAIVFAEARYLQG